MAQRAAVHLLSGRASLVNLEVVPSPSHNLRAKFQTHVYSFGNDHGTGAFERLRIASNNHRLGVLSNVPSSNMLQAGLGSGASL